MDAQQSCRPRPRAASSTSQAPPAPRRARRRPQAAAVKQLASREARDTKENALAARYTLGPHIGSGSYGLVHSCTAVDGSELAVKVLSKTRAKQSREKTLRKLAKEMDILSRIQESSGVIKLVDVLEDDSFAYIVQELCKGGDLETVLKTHGPFSERAAAAVLYEALKVIALCHANNVLHGDVKPANFMLRQSYHAPLAALESGDLGHNWLKAIDFGCSQLIRRLPLTRRTGTPVYMAPEVFKREYGREADLWSLGIMMYQLVTGRLPFWDTVEQCRSKTLEEVMNAVVYSDIPLDYGPWLDFSPEGLDLLQRLCEREPRLRLSAAEALEHPWFQRHLARHSSPEGEAAAPQGHAASAAAAAAELAHSMPSSSTAVFAAPRPQARARAAGLGAGDVSNILPLTAPTAAASAAEPPAPSCTLLRSTQAQSPRRRLRALQVVDSSSE